MKNPKNHFLFTFPISCFFSLYIFSMFIYPWLYYNGNWEEVQRVLDRWQTFNTGMIALLASIFAIMAAKYQYNHDRKNNFRASKSKLPHALSDLSTYTKQCASIHQQLYALENQEERRSYIDNSSFPEYPINAVDTFFECIKFAPQDVGDELSKILELLQITNSRFQSLKNDKNIITMKFNNISEIKFLAGLSARVDNLFDFSRNSSVFKQPAFSKEELTHAVFFTFGIRNIEIEFQ